MSNELIEAIPTEPARASDSRVLMALIERAATSSDFDMAKLQQLLDLKDRWEAGEARKAFVAAMAAFKASPPEIVKDKHVRFTTTRGVTEYDHATLGRLCSAVIKGLAEHKISHSWDVSQDNRILVTCILTHAQGHSERVSLHAAPDESGGKNAIQSIGSAITYLQRYTLLAATGLAALDQDDDGKASGQAFITEDQITVLMDLAKEVKADRDRFLQFMEVEQLADIPADQFIKAKTALESKRGKANVGTASNI